MNVSSLQSSRLPVCCFGGRRLAASITSSVSDAPRRLSYGVLLRTRRRRGEQIDVAWVPGAFEIPLAARSLAESGSLRGHRHARLRRFVGVRRTSTTCATVLTDGVREVMRDTGVPVAFGVLTTDDVEQALERAGGAEGNKGADVAAAAIEMARLGAALGAAG